MNEGKKSYKLDCLVPTSKLISESILFIAIVLCTGGLALPFGLFRIGKVLMDNTEIIEK